MERKSQYDFDGEDTRLGDKTEEEFDDSVICKNIIVIMPTKEQDKINGIDRILKNEDGTLDYVQIKSQGKSDNKYYCIPVGLKYGSRIINKGIFDSRFKANMFAFERCMYNEFVMMYSEKMREFILKNVDLSIETEFKSTAQKYRRVYVRTFKHKKDFLVYLSQEDFEEMGIAGVYHKNNGKKSGSKSIEPLSKFDEFLTSKE